MTNLSNSAPGVVTGPKAQIYNPGVWLRKEKETGKARLEQDFEDLNDVNIL